MPKHLFRKLNSEFKQKNYPLHGEYENVRWKPKHVASNLSFCITSAELLFHDKNIKQKYVSQPSSTTENKVGI